MSSGFIRTQKNTKNSNHLFRKTQKGGASFYESARDNMNGFFSKLSGSDPNDSTWRKCVFKYTIMTIVLIGISSVILNIITNPGSAIYNIQKYFFVIVFPLLMIFAILLNVGRDTEGTSALLKIGGMVAVVIVCIYYYSQSTGSNVVYSVFTNYATLALIVFIGMGIAYNAMVKYMEHLEGWP